MKKRLEPKEPEATQTKRQVLVSYDFGLAG
jgi:hypothetical protein